MANGNAPSGGTVLTLPIPLQPESALWYHFEDTTILLTKVLIICSIILPRLLLVDWQVKLLCIMQHIPSSSS